MTTKLGRISSVFVDDDRNKIFVSVITSPGVEHRQIPFVTEKPSFWIVPQEGDIVEVYELDREMAARFPQNDSTQQIPNLGEGDVCLKLDEDTEIRFQKNGEETYDVTLKASGELRLLDNTGHGIVGSGGGNFTWYHNHIDLDSNGTFSED